eukprot:4479314-Prymnesium_polylepis.2
MKEHAVTIPALASAQSTHCASNRAPTTPCRSHRSPGQPSAQPTATWQAPRDRTGTAACDAATRARAWDPHPAPEMPTPVCATPTSAWDR